MSVKPGNISRKSLSKVLRKFVKNFERLQERALSVIDEVQTVCEKTEALILQGFRESDKNLFIDLLIQAGENITAELRIERKGDEFND